MTDKNANDLTKSILLKASELGARLFRRNVGMAWAGKSIKFTKTETITVQAGDVLVKRALPFHNGTAGMSDTWGWKSIVITPDMIGQRVAVHVEIEVKFGRDRESSEQKSWRAFCEQQGVRVGVARTVGEATDIISPTDKP